jgi:glycosyltransferase involved in cell wall biosynthesis
MNELSIILPAHNEAVNLRPLLVKLTGQYPAAEIIVVNDGSTDETAAVCRAAGVRVISHPYSLGNGAAIKAGARAASGATLVFMDADGQHDPADIPRLLAKLEDGYDMAVGARRDHSNSEFADFGEVV